MAHLVWDLGSRIKAESNSFWKVAFFVKVSAVPVSLHVHPLVVANILYLKRLHFLAATTKCDSSSDVYNSV